MRFHPTFKNKLYTDEIIHLELRSDFTAIQIDRTGNPQYNDGELIYYVPGGETLRFTVRIIARGNFRRMPENCSFPPLFINFKKKEVNNTIFDGQDKLKLVTPCQDEADVIEEYTVCKMYNRVTDLSFRVRLAKILYYDSSIGKKLFESYSYFIEDKDHVAEMNNCYEYIKFMTPFDLDKENYMKLSFFQYIIGNEDSFVVSRKNIVALQPDDSSLSPYAIPFDFDFSGFVYADYSKPKDIPEELMRNRRSYKGICYTNDELEEVFDFFRKLRPELKSVIINQKPLSRKERKYILTYIRYFYNIIGNKSLIKKEFIDICEKKRDYNIIDE